MQIRFILAASVLSLLPSFAANAAVVENNTNRFGIQGAMATGGNLSIGIVDFTEKTELGFTLSGSFNNAHYETKTIAPVIFGGLRKAIGSQTYFAYGIDAVGIFGRDSGVKIDSNYLVGPYISLEQMLTPHLMLTGWIQPYQYQYFKTCHTSVSTNSFFSSGGIGLNYFF